MITTAITTAFAIVAGIINHIMSGKRDRHNQQTAASLKYTEQQLEQLYGPLAFLVWEGRHTYTDLVNKFIEIREEKQISEKNINNYAIFNLKNEAEIQLWIFWIEKDAFPRHEKIKELLMTKTHLIEGTRMPDSYLNFLNYHNSWKIEHLQWKEQQIEYSYKSKVEFPPNFEEDVINTFEKLKLRQAKFIKLIR
ncbi:hypothetical protein IQ244_19190 [Nostoc sp. LEGE 06077]|nr:hypothetical protein [Nostoc sp. LEGE 06077]